MATPPAGGWTKKHEARARDAGYASYVDWLAEIEAELGYEVCGAWAKSRRRPCRYKPLLGDGHPNGRCRLHGGLSLVGVAAPTFRTGKHSKVLSGAFGAAYEASLESGQDQIDLAEQLALLDGIEARAVEALGSALAKPDLDAALAAEDRLREVGLDRKRLAEAQRRLFESRHDAILRERFEAILVFLAVELRSLVAKHVDDVAVGRALLVDFQRAVLRFDESGGKPPIEISANGNGGPPSTNGKSA